MTASLPFLDPARPRADRIEDLLSRLTLLEKINQLGHANHPIERLGVPAYNWWNEACHGVGRCGRATVFPQVIGLGATWNRELVHRIASAISDEARAKHHAAAAEGRRGQYQGLTFWTPNINIYRDPRWGRGQETFGEDPYLTGELGVATVRGLQGDHPDYLKTAACAKHFAVHSGPEQARHVFDARPTPKDLAETYLPAFERLVRAGVEAVMGAYNRTLGEPCCASRFLLQEALRERWGFRGHVVSDCGAIDDFHLHHHTTSNAAESAALAVKRGCDLNCGCTYDDLFVAVRDGLITEAEIDVSLRRLLATKFKLGCFDAPERVPWSTTPLRVVECDEHRALARTAAVESMVLLKNNGVLPLRDHDSLLVTGPTAASVDALVGNYYGFSSRMITIAEGILERAPATCRASHRLGCPLSGTMAPGINYTLLTAAENEVVIAVLGLDGSLEGEEGDTVASLTGGDRIEIELPRVQREFFQALRKQSRRLVVVLTGGGAVAVPEIHELADAVLQVWYPGCEGGRAVAQVLFGDVAPSGRLPVTVPFRTPDLPPFDDYAMRGRTYRYARQAPLYPFGFGLSYARVTYERIELSVPRLAQGERVTVRAVLTNATESAALETVQCYVQPMRVAPDDPLATLVDFEKIAVPAHATRSAEFVLPSDAFALVDEQGTRAHAPGRYRVVVGAASPGARAQALGAPKPVVAEIELL